MNYQYPIIAINRGGETRIFNDAESLWAFIRDRDNGNVGAYWREVYTSVFNPYGTRRLERVFDETWRDSLRGYDNDWILRDDLGRVVDKTKIPAPPYRYSKWTLLWDRREKEQRQAAERGDAIPYLRSRFRRRSSKKWTKNGRNGAHNQRKGIKLYEDPKIRKGDFDDL